MDLSTQIIEKQNQVYEFERMQRAGDELAKLEAQKRQQDLRNSELGQIESLQKQIDKVASGIDNSHLLLIGKTLLKLAKQLAQWQKTQDVNRILFELVQQQIQLQLKYRQLNLTPSQKLAFDQGMRSGLIQDLTKDRLNQLGISDSFDLSLDGAELDNDTQRWFNIIANSIRSVLRPVSNSSMF